MTTASARSPFPLPTSPTAPASPTTITSTSAAEYAINDAGTVGLQYFDDGDTSFNTPGDEGEHYTLYGSYVFGQITAKAYVAQRQGGAGDDTAYGIGADYDLGGALLAVSVREDYDSNTLADFGVKFNF